MTILERRDVSPILFGKIGSIVGRLRHQGLVGKRKAGESLQQLEQLEARVALDADGSIWQHAACSARSFPDSSSRRH